MSFWVGDRSIKGRKCTEVPCMMSDDNTCSPKMFLVYTMESDPLRPYVNNVALCLITLPS
jgi:hypothetical protein